MGIPEMTDPLGKYWEQPKRENVFFKRDKALITEKDLNLLPEYSHSTPSGVYAGKMWKRAFFPKPSGYLLCWYDYHPEYKDTFVIKTALIEIRKETNELLAELNQLDQYMKYFIERRVENYKCQGMFSNYFKAINPGWISSKSIKKMIEAMSIEPITFEEWKKGKQS